MLLRNTRSAGDGTCIPHETIFNGPDFAHAVGIYRGDGMARLGRWMLLPAGGPAYSAQVFDDSDAMLAFLTEVLGMGASDHLEEHEPRSIECTKRHNL